VLSYLLYMHFLVHYKIPEWDDCAHFSKSLGVRDGISTWEI
jgi:hypothetical protein